LLGTWRLLGSTVVLSDLIDASGRFALPVDHAQKGEFKGDTTALETSRYIFTMTLGLRSRPTGRWNKLDFLKYESVNMATGDVDPVTLTHERQRPFWFSKVKSY
jgi:F-box protein 9